MYVCVCVVSLLGVNRQISQAMSQHKHISTGERVFDDVNYLINHPKQYHKASNYKQENMSSIMSTV